MLGPIAQWLMDDSPVMLGRFDSWLRIQLRTSESDPMGGTARVLQFTAHMEEKSATCNNVAPTSD